MLHKLALCLSLTLAGAVAGCLSPASPADVESAETFAPPAPRAAPWQLDKRRHPAPHVVATQTAAAQRPGPVIKPNVTPAPKLTYLGGPLIDSVVVYAVLWGPNVDPAIKAGLPGYYQATTSDAPYMQMLSEYDQPPAPIAHGTFGGLVVDAAAPPGTPDPMSKTFVVQDQDVQSELSRLVDEGALPAPDGHNIYMVYFDAQTLLPGACTQYCAYHSSFARNGQATYYAIMPDLGHNGCNPGCGFDTPLNNLYSTSAHELVEAVTDADVGPGNYAWLDTTSGNEIGDICTDWDGLASGYVVQSQWSNESNGCRDHRPTPVTTGTITAGDATVAPGGTATFNVTTSGNAPGPWTLDVRDYVIRVGNQQATKEYPFTFTPPTVSAGGTSKLTLTVPADEKVFGFGTLGYQLHPHIAATDANGVHRFIEVNLDVVTGAPAITKIAPAMGPTLGGTKVVVTGTNFAADAKGFFCPAAGACDPASNAVPVVGGASSSDGKSFAFTTPDHAAGAARFMLQNPADSARTAFAKFTFTVAKKSAPTITSVAPGSGPTVGGTSIEVTGSNFDQASAGGTPNLTLYVGGVVATGVFVADAQHLFATTPKHAAGSVNVQVTNADKQTAIKTNAFIYGSGNAPASGLSLTPAMGPTSGGNYVIINGNNFVAGVTVTFGGAAATVKSVNPSFIDVLVPPHAAGMVPVVVTNALAPASPPLMYTFVAAPPPDMTQLADMTGTPITDDLGPPADDLGGSDDLATGGGGHGGSGGTNVHLGGGGCAVAGERAPAAPPLMLLLAVALLLGRAARRRRA